MQCVSSSVIKSYLVTKGTGFSLEIVKQEADLTPEMIQRYTFT